MSDDREQTYMTHNENRDGNAVTGSYSYVDPNGSLITVTYTADENGYNETREVQEKFVEISEKPKRTTTPKPTQPPRRPAPSNDSDLVAKIIAQLTPFIKQTVSNSLSN